MYKLTPYHRKHRKIGRNEPCPCGRTKETVRDEAIIADGVTVGFHKNKTVQVPVKYKHCCGHIDNQRRAVMIRRYMDGFLARLFNQGQGKKKSKLRKIINLFGRDKK